MLVPIKNLPMFTVFEFGICLYVKVTNDMIYNYSTDEETCYEFDEDTLVLPYGRLTLDKKNRWN